MCVLMGFEEKLGCSMFKYFIFPNIRPLNDDELKMNVPSMVSCNEHKREVTVTSKQTDRIFAFDKVYFFYLLMLPCSYDIGHDNMLSSNFS